MPGIPFGAMAQVSPCFLSVSQPSGPTISTETQPSAFAAWQVFTRSHLSPAVLKHQKTIDCLMFPLVMALPVSARAGETVAAADTASAPFRAARRVMAAGFGFIGGSSGCGRRVYLARPVGARQTESRRVRFRPGR